MATKNQRGLKTSRSQFEAYLNERRINKAFRENKFDGSDPDILKRTWDQLSAKLNVLGGPCRDVTGWKRVFCDWRSQTRGKARKLRLSQSKTGNTGAPPKPLTDLEDQLLDLTGRVVVTGMENVPEIGIDGPIKPASCAADINQNENILTEQNCSQDIVMANDSADASGSPKTPTTSNKTRILSTSQSKENIRTSKKKTSLFGYLEGMANTDKNETVEVLGIIAKELKLRKKIETKKLQLQVLKLQLKYPNHDFLFDDSS